MDINRDKQRPVKLNINRGAAVDFALVAGSFLAARTLVFDAASPFVLAYISAFLFKGNKFYGAALFASLGIISSFRGEFSMKYLLAIVMLCVANLFLSLRPKMAAGMLQAATAAGASFAAGLVLIFLRGQGLYFLAINLLEGLLIFALAIVLAKGIGCLTPGAKRGALHNEELIAIVVLAGVLALGAADVSIWHLSMRHFFAVLIVLLASQSGGAAVGAVCGMFLGFMLNIAGFEYIYFAVLLGAAGFGAGAARFMGRLLTIGTFMVVGLLAVLYFDLGLLNMSTAFSAVGAAVAFYFLPKGLLLNIHTTLNPATAHQGEYVDKVKERVVDRIYDFAAGYGRLAAVFEARLAGRRRLGDERMKTVEEMRGGFCGRCHKYEQCWGGDEKFGRYVAEMVEKGEKGGRIVIDDVPLELSARCVHLSEFIGALWTQMDRQRMQKDWEQRLTEARKLVAQQFSGLSGVMYEFAGELAATLDFRQELENRIIREFGKLRIEVENVIVVENRRGKYEISLSRKGRGSKKQDKEIGQLLSGVVRRKMELAEERLAGHMVRLSYVEQQKFYIQSGVAKANKDMAGQSGDSFSLVQLRGGRCIAALSDGMGSGARAKEESEATIELLEELMERGFQKDIALRLINSALLLKSSDEFFSTLDICLLDMNSGMVEFVKIGAACSYLLRGEEVEAIGSWTLPVGILETIDVDVHEKQLQHGDIVVMMTDGVADSLKGADSFWIEELLVELPKNNPQDIAECILDAARENYRGVVGDDMTVLVLRAMVR
ncbi:MAG: stage II sporulation protein E [Defluviitaleaceae bacterium]|nr:stage II sporulation protein E [Defluviitaleaceae bacterium]